MSNPTATIWQSSVSPMWQQGDIRGNIGQTKPILTKKVTDYALALYLMTVVLVTLMYSSYSLPWYYMLSGVGAVVCVFTYGKKLTDRFSVYRVSKEKVFEKKLFYIALGLRIAWMALIYVIFSQSYGDAFGFENGDAKFYHDLGEFVAGMINRGEFNFYDKISKWSGTDDISDMGYGIYVGFIYFLTGHSGTGGPQSFVSTEAGTHIVSIMTVRLIKCFLSAYTVLLVYRLAKRTFGEQVGRLSAIFCALWPNFWYYCGSHLKETEMVFLCVLFIEQADQMLRSRKFTTWKVAPVLLVGVLIFTMRTVLAFVALLSLIFSVVMSSSRVVDWGKRIAVGVLAVSLIGVTMGNRLQERASNLIRQARSDQQAQNMQWRSTRANANVFSKYASKSIFAPLIFTIPFPSYVRPFQGQEVQQLLNGGNFVKSFLSYFTLIAIVSLFLSGKWRDYLLPLSFVLGYMVVLAFSSFAQSERFHQPAMPFEFMFMAYGMSVVATNKRYKRWFTYWCVLIFVGCVAWNWFKLAGRGLS